MRALVFPAALAALLCTFPFASGAEEKLRFEFQIDGQLNGTRPWDGSGVSSAAVDSDPSKGGGLTDLVPWGGLVDIGKQAALDQFNQRIAAPDPYFCLVFRAGAEADCYRERMKKDSIQISLSLPPGVGSFGMILADADIAQANVAKSTAFGDDLIGFGVYLDEPTLAAVRAGDADATRRAKELEAAIAAEVRRLFLNSSRALTVSRSAELDLSRLAIGKCTPSCRFGDSTVTVARTVNDW